MVNKAILKSVLGIVKLATMVFGLVVTCLIAKYSGTSFENDRFNFMVTYGMMVFLWCLVTLLLYLFDVASKCKPGTMPTLEIVGSVFLLLLAAQAFVYGVTAATALDRIEGKCDTKSKGSNGLSVDPEISGFATLIREHIPPPNALSGFFRKCSDAALLAKNLNAAAAAFCAFTMISFAFTIFVAKRKGVPGSPETQGAYVE